MPEQETLADSGGNTSSMFAVDPSQHGLWSRVTESGRIAHPVWLRAVAENGFVGTCRRCGSYLRPLSPDDRGDGVFDYEAQCVNEVTYSIVDGRRTVRGCGAVMVAPGGRLPGTADRERKAAAAAVKANRRGGKGKAAS